MTMRFRLFALPLLLAACDSPMAADMEPYDQGQTSKAAVSQGLYRVEGANFPFYARAEPTASVGGFGYQDGEWAAIVFYRDPACVPGGFDLFQFYDVPGAFFCPATVSGFALHTEPFGMTPPKSSHLRGDAVPIWFVPSSGAFAQAVEAGTLTMAQLAAMPGLVMGIATHFNETLTTIENHPSPKINITARGYILPQSGGGTFRYNVNWSGLTVADVQNIRIDIR